MSNDWVCIENTGEMDLRLLELMGASTKDGEDTIGMFGTGWKYGLALALRKEIPVVIYAGETSIQFSTMEEVIRDTTFHRIAISVDGKRRRKTSLTTELGGADWDDEWMFLREVISNSLDEGGFRAYRTDVAVGEPGKTRVYIQTTQRLSEVLNNKEAYFRRGVGVYECPDGKLFKPLGDKCRIYKRGVFVREMPDGGVYDYDLNDLKLTESRTADTFEVTWQISKLLNKVPPEQLAEIMKALNDKDRSVVEAEYYDTYTTKDGRWSDAFTLAFGVKGTLCTDDESVCQTVESAGFVPVTLPQKVADVLRKGHVETSKTRLGEAAAAGLPIRPPTSYESVVLEKVVEIAAMLYGPVVPVGSIGVFRNEGKWQNVRTHGITEDGERKLHINEIVFAEGVPAVFDRVQSEILQDLSILDGRRDMYQAFVRKELLPSMGVVL